MAWQFCIAAFPETSASTVFGLHDVFASVGPEWRQLQGEAPGEPLIEARIVAEGPGPLTCCNGTLLHPHVGFDAVTHADVVCIPEILVDQRHAPYGVHPRLVGWIRQMHERGALIASVCSGSLLLAEAGLLDGLEASTHWGYADYLRRHYPAVQVRHEQVLCLAGEPQRVVTGGGAAAWHDLALYLIGRFCGAEHAVQTAKLHLLQWHGDGQLPYASLTARRHEDAAIGASQVWLAEHYDEPNPVAGAAAVSGLQERTFGRRFLLATGLTPLDYVHQLRVEEAKQALEASDTTIDAISAAVGYADPTFFRRLFKRKTGVTPNEYRRMFRLPDGLRRRQAR